VFYVFAVNFDRQRLNEAVNAVIQAEVTADGARAELDALQVDTGLPEDGKLVGCLLSYSLSWLATDWWLARRAAGEPPPPTRGRALGSA
jgi:hypothetical protein